MIEADAISDFNFLMGDMNFKFNQTYDEIIDHINDAPNLVKNLD